MKSTPIQVWLLTGFLGSGKTSLLLNWLHDPALANVALVINEIGEVGIDDKLAASVVDYASVLTGACMCCAGLEGLEETLSELWWDRLYRRRPNFDVVVIETTGLAEPQSIQESFRRHPLLRERYVLHSTVTMVSATQGCLLLGSWNEAMAQVIGADTLVVTKTDSADASDLISQLTGLNPRARLLRSSHAGLPWHEIQTATSLLPFLSKEARLSPVSPAAHSHPFHTQFVTTPSFNDITSLHAKLEPLISGDLVRLKGIVLLKDQKMLLVQWSWLDKALTITAHEGLIPEQWGLTCIRKVKDY